MLRGPVAFFVVLAIAVGSAAPARASSGKELVETILESSDRAERNRAARELADLLKPGPVRTLVRKSDDSRRAAAAIDVIEERLGGRATGDRKKSIRVRAIKALAVIDTDTAADVLVRLAVGDPVRTVRNAAERAIVSSGDVAIAALLGVFASAPDYDSRSGVIAILHAIEGKHGEEVAAAWPTLVEPLIAALATPESPDAVALLSEIGAPAVPRLIEVARPQIVVDNPVEDPRANAEFALIKMAATDRTQIALLEQALDTRDLALVADLSNFYIQLGKPGSEEVLIAALESLGTTDRASAIALEFLNSGHPPLADAGRDWAGRHGFSVTGQGSGQVLWGNLGGDPTS